MDVELPAIQRVGGVRENQVKSSDSRQNGDSPPPWLFRLATEVRSLVRSAEGMARFREMIRTWAREVGDWHSTASQGSLEGVPVEPLPYHDGIDLIPIPDRVLTLAEKYAVLGAVHDVCWKGEKIDPWHPVPPFPPREAMRYAVLLCAFQVPPNSPLVNAGEWTIPDHDEHFLKEFIEDVRHDLETNDRRTRPESGMPSGGGQMILPVPGPLIWNASQILGMSSKAVTYGKSIIKVRELNPHEQTFRIDDYVPFTTTMSNMVVYLAPRSATEDPRGGQVPIFKRDEFGVWFSAHPDVRHLFEQIWESHLSLPAILGEFLQNLTDENLRRFASGLTDFEGLVARFRSWLESVAPPFRGMIANPNAPRTFPGTVAEFQILANAMRQATSSHVPDPGPAARDVPREPATPTAFSGGTMSFFDDHVELCGVNITGRRPAGSSRKILDVLRQKRGNRFVAHSGDELVAKTQIKSASIQGAVRDLRERIQERLLAEANIDCGEEDVILTDDEGYRLADSINLSVQFVSEAEQGHTDQGGDAFDPVTAAGCDPVNVPVRDPVKARDPVKRGDNDPVNVPVIDPDDPVSRRTWIVHQIASGRQLRAPQIAEEIGCSEKTAKRDLDSLKEEQQIEFVGAPKTGYYQLTRPAQADA